jgi:hypothetical protein
MYIHSKYPQKCSAHFFVVVFKHPFGIITILRVFLFLRVYVHNHNCLQRHYANEFTTKSISAGLQLFHIICSLSHTSLNFHGCYSSFLQTSSFKSRLASTIFSWAVSGFANPASKHLIASEEQNKFSL